jgi:hypothetical protein
MAISGNDILTYARKFLGDPYVWGGTGPDSFDCSGLVYYVLNHLGVHDVPRVADDQYGWTTRIQESQLAPGDLIFSRWSGDDVGPHGVGHVGIYAGNGQVLEASQSGEPVHIIPYDRNYKQHTVGYGRVPSSSAGSATPGIDNTDSTTATMSATLVDIPGMSFLGPILGGTSGVASTVADLAVAFQAMLSSVNAAITLFSSLFKPQLWLRVGMFIVGVLGFTSGVIILARSV